MYLMMHNLDFRPQFMTRVCRGAQRTPICSQTDPLPLELVHQLIAHCEKGGLLFLFLCNLQRYILWHEA